MPKKKLLDPHRQREANKYEFPVPSREFIVSYLEEYGQPVSFNHLLQHFALKKPEEQEGLQRRLRAMERDGQIMTTRRSRYALVNKLDLVAGTVDGTREGFGFLIPDDNSADIFLPVREMQKVFPGDRVLVRISNAGYGKRREGEVVEIVERNTQQLAGKLYAENGMLYLVPDSKIINQDILIPPQEQQIAKAGDYVVAEIIRQPQRRRQPLARVVKILGDQFTSGLEVELAINSHQIPYEWSDDIAREVIALPEEVVFDGKEKDRKDLRHLAFVTIDGADAKDFDDAVYCEKQAHGWGLYVAIADVSHYVQPNTALDQEAFLRGNSVYFPSRVIPMLPEALSNNLCSLKPQVDRLVMVCQMSIDNQGVITHYQFYPAIIHSCARLIYDDVAEFLTAKNADHSQAKELRNLYALYKKLFQQRQKRGAIDFDTEETYIVMDDKGRIDKILPRTRNEAHRIIEEMMLAANECAAKLVAEADIDTLYRIHDLPDVAKVEQLREFLLPFGLKLPKTISHARDYVQLIKKIKERPDYHLLQMVLLRSMQQAIYSPEKRGHFGLAYDCYAHFTSPIRRYPDLLLHRALKHIIAGKAKEAFLYDWQALLSAGQHCSMTERRADLATRDATDWLKCEYMQDKLGEIYNGKITGVTSFGIFVTLKEVYVEGLVHISALQNDYYHFDAKQHQLVGKRSGQKYRLGDEVTVQVSRVDMEERQIDFVPAS